MFGSTAFTAEFNVIKQGKGMSISYNIIKPFKMTIQPT